MTTNKKREEIDALTLQEKQKRTDFTAMQERGIVVWRSSHWMLCLNEAPYEGSHHHLVMRYVAPDKKDRRLSFAKKCASITAKFSGLGYEIRKNAVSNMSCDFRYHIHFILWERK